MEYRSVDMEEGSPGNLNVVAEFSYSGGIMMIRYSTASDADTIANIINHSYFHLKGRKKQFCTEYHFSSGNNM